MMNFKSAVCMMLALMVVSNEITERCPTTLSITSKQPRCLLSGGTEIELTWAAGKYITLECYGNGTFTCAELPRVNIFVPPMRVMIENCELPVNESLICTFQALGAPDASWLTLRGVYSFPTSEHVQSLNLTVLNLEDPKSDTFTLLPTGAIAALPSLKSLTVMNARLSLTSNSLAGVSKLKYLEISSSEIRGLNESVFRKLKSLHTLNLFGNDLRELKTGTFDGLNLLNILDLRNNPLQTLGEGVLAAAKNLRELILMGTELEELNEPALRNLSALENLTISDGLKRLRVGARALSLPKLSMLHIERSRLAKLSGDALIGAHSLQSLSLADNTLETLPSELLTDLKELLALNLSRNALQSLGADMFLHTQNLRELKLDDNNLEVFSDALFEPLTKLIHLSARNNRLHSVWSTKFRGLGALQSLDLAHNQLTLSSEAPENKTLYGEIIPLGLRTFPSQSPLHMLEQLRHLDLGHNRITQVFDDWRNSLNHLQWLDLSHNWIEVLEDHDTNFLRNVMVDFRYNQISVIKIQEKDQYAREDHEDTRKCSLLLGENPFNCDCRTYRLLRLLANSSYAYILPAINIDGAVCASPPALANTTLRAAPLDKLTCELIAPECPKNCNCTEHPSRYTAELDCSELPGTVPTPEQFRFNRTALRLRRAPLTLNLSLPVHELKLSGLGLKRLPPGPTPPQLELLDLTDNLLTELLLSGGYKLRLAGNPLACDCAHYDAVNTLLLSTNRVEDWSNVTCAGGRYLKHIKDADGLCAEVRAVWTASVGGTLALLGLLVIVVAIIWLRYQNEIKVYLFARGWCGCLTRSGKEAPAKYDVFLSFSHEDEEVVVQKLVPELERRGYRLCVHYRDWAPGETIAEHVSRSVQEARRTLVVVSPGFMCSEWARAEFREAHARALREGRSRVIVVLLGELPEASGQDEVRTYLRTNTYVAWGDAWFWEKLQYALPHRPLGHLEGVPLIARTLSADKLLL